MSRRILMAVAAFGLALFLAGPGSAIAGERESPEFGTWQYWEAVESGNYRPPKASVQEKADRKDTQKDSLIELGGIPFRVGLDTN